MDTTEANHREAYVCIFVSLTVKALHLELVSDLTSDAFIDCLRRCIARRGCPSLIWSDWGTNFVGADQFWPSLNLMKYWSAQSDMNHCGVKNPVIFLTCFKNSINLRLSQTYNAHGHVQNAVAFM